MPIDPHIAIGSVVADDDFTWTLAEVMAYHLALGAGGNEAEADELRYVSERGLQVLPTFALTAPATLGVAAPQHVGVTPPEIALPGVTLSLSTLLYAEQTLVVHRPIPVRGAARVRTWIDDVYDKATAAIIVQDSEAVGDDGRPLFSARSSLFARGEGGFGGKRGPSPRTVAAPDREPDVVLETPTLEQQALLYGSCADGSPVHVDPDYAREAGFPRPILQGPCTYGTVCNAVVDAMLGGDASRVSRYHARFAGVVFPGETLRTRIWRTDEDLFLATSVVERCDEPVLIGEITLENSRELSC